MNKMTMTAALIASAALCIPATAGSAEKKAVPAAISAPPAGKGQIVFYRPGSLMGAAIRCTVRKDGKMVGRLMRGKYFVSTVEPGMHAFTTKTEATDTVNVNVDPDDTQYVQCKIGAGFASGRPNLSPATKAEFDAKAGKLEHIGSEDLAKLIAEDDGK